MRKKDRKWVKLKGYGDNYLISNYGEVYRKPVRFIGNDGREYFYDKKIIKGGLNNSGYHIVNLKSEKDGIFRPVLRHKLVAKHFIPNPNNYPSVGFKDGNKNNIHVDNLYWTDATPKTSVSTNCGETHYKANLDKYSVMMIYLLTQDPSNYKNTEICEIMKNSFGIEVNHRTVSNIRYKTQWKSVLNDLWF